MPHTTRRCPKRGRSLLRLLSLAALGTLAWPATAAQPEPADPPARIPAPAMEDEPYTIHELGVRLVLPRGTTVRTERAGSSVAVTFAPPSMNGLIIVQSRQVTDPARTVDQVGDSILEQFQRAGGRTMARMSSLIIGDEDVDRFYVSSQQTGLGASDEQVRGFTVFKPEPLRFVLVELVTDRDEFAAARSIYETVAATLTFEDPGRISTGRRAKLLAGQRLRERFTAADFETAIETNADRWERLYRPASSGSDRDAEELGYRRVEAWRGRRGEMDPTKPPSRFTAAEQAEGYLVRLTARVLVDGQTIDSRSTMFVSLDDTLEVWRVDMLLRAAPNVRQEPRRFTEYGTRENGRIEVRVEASHDTPTRVSTDLPDIGYLSRVEEVLLPQLLANSGVLTDLAFYTFRSDAQSLRLRQDSVSRTGGQSPAWMIRSHLSENADAQETSLAADGRPLGMTLPDGRVWQPINQQRLVALWREKGLPLD